MAEKKEKDEKSEIEKKLFVERKSAWEILDKKEIKDSFELAEEYKLFLNENKSEREIVAFAKKTVEKKGFVDISKATASSKKIFAINHDKNILILDLSEGKISNGLRILGSHIDSVRLDFKLSPVYESDGFAMINLHYYGGIKKYHWLNVPLAMHGVVFDKKGNKINISLGEKESEPVFVISDLLPHLEGKEFESEKATEIIKGEDMDAIGASMPIDDKKVKEKIKATFLKALNDKYNIIEEDFISAEVSLYPATKARDVGVDKAIIGAPAHDDRACSFVALKSLLDSKSRFPSAVLFVDKEEIGSTGNTAMSSIFLEETLTKIAKMKGEKVSGQEILFNSMAISADGTSGLDTKYMDKMDLTNVNKMGHGIAIEKATGSGGKYYGSDANAEYMSFIRQILGKANVPFQYGEMGKVDQGGGGTIAYLLAKYNMNIVDAGPPILAMHSPFELLSKIDLYCTYKAYKAFLELK